ncbi:MAG: hemerythrin domain-containing protein [Bacillota bacterium]
MDTTTVNPINELKDEHQAVKLTLRILGEISTRLIEGKKTEPAHLDELIEFLTTFVDKCHHGKEEELLFPALEKAGVPREGGPIGVMLHEHELGRVYIKGLRQGAADLKTGNDKAVAMVTENIKNYSDLLTQHIEKEDNILYPIAEQRFSSEQNSKLLEGFAGIEEERIGVGKHEEFHRMLHRLQKVYLG